MSAAATIPACIGEPISWLRLEQFARAHADGAIRAHLDACPACRACLDEIERDVVALPPLAVPAAPPRRAWWRWAVPAGLAIAAAALALLVLRPRDPSTTPGRADVMQVKGVGTLELGVVRERGGVVRDDVTTFAHGDRWKVVITCAADHVVSVETSVVEAGAEKQDAPLAPARVVCGNRIPLAGAFTLTGARPHRVCVRVAGEPGRACVTLTPE